MRVREYIKGRMWDPPQRPRLPPFCSLPSLVLHLSSFSFYPHNCATLAQPATSPIDTHSVTLEKILFRIKNWPLKSSHLTSSHLSPPICNMSGLALPKASNAGPSGSNSKSEERQMLDGEGSVATRPPQKAVASVPEITAVDGLVPTLQWVL